MKTKKEKNKNIKKEKREYVSKYQNVFNKIEEKLNTIVYISSRINEKLSRENLVVPRDNYRAIKAYLIGLLVVFSVMTFICLKRLNSMSIPMSQWIENANK